uniref:hypothetical protein n=1 Tax=Actinacidiphila yanglinensis TaxID=310779 RepID=UPI003899143C
MAEAQKIAPVVCVQNSYGLDWRRADESGLGNPASGSPLHLRLRLCSVAAQLVTTGRRRHLRFTRHWPWTDVITSAVQRLDALPNPD